MCVCVRGSTTRQQHTLGQSLRLQIHHVHAHSIVWLSCEQRFLVRMCGIPGVETRKHTPFSPQRTGCLGDVATTERDELDCRFRQEFASVSAITLHMFILLNNTKMWAVSFTKTSYLDHHTLWKGVLRRGSKDYVIECRVVHLRTPEDWRITPQMMGLMMMSLWHNLQSGLACA